ncbi:MAG TPA: GntR family transcriptional regulator [Bryobacteraceae bacterium]|jgi:DNA-binding GntR family transcriptional regulator|nr:GntR family transcriptional regulator [Bryobacteraceae bacterium]
MSAKKRKIDDLGNNRSMRDKAYVHIQRKIAARELTGGSPVSELLLARELGISRTPIREAMGQLVAEGLLDQIPNRGVVVVQLNRRDIIDLYELREALEVYAVGKAAQYKINRSDLARLQELADGILEFKRELEDSGKPALNSEQMHRFVSRDLAFHTLLMRIAANRRILKVVNETRLLIRIFTMHRDGHKISDLEQIHRYHSDVTESIARQDHEHAMHVIAEHIQASLRERLEQYDHWEREMSLRESEPIFFDVFTTAESQ